MLRWLLLLVTSLCLPIQFSLSASTIEAETLWTEGKAAIDAQRFQEAIRPLQRYVENYPGYPNYLLAHFLLGHAYSSLEMDEKSTEPLKYCASAAGPDSDLKEHCRIELAKNNLALKNFHGAYLLAQEAKVSREKRPDTEWFYYEIQLIEIEALLGLSNEALAERLLNLALKYPPELPAKLKAQASLLHTQFKLRQCSRLPSKGPLNEAQIQDQLERKGVCLREALVYFQDTLKNDDPRSGKRGTRALVYAFDEYYSENCAHLPVGQVKLDPKGTTLEHQRFNSELTESLIQNCRKTLADSLTQVRNWNQDPTLHLKDSLALLIKGLESLQ